MRSGRHNLTDCGYEPNESVTFIMEETKESFGQLRQEQKSESILPRWSSDIPRTKNVKEIGA